MSSKSRKYRAYSAGRECYERGGSINDCPYSSVDNGALRSAWLDGYTDATLAVAPLYE